jgi:small subunit ribosomal protein S18
MSEETQAKAPETSAPVASQAATGTDSAPVSTTGSGSGHSSSYGHGTGSGHSASSGHGSPSGHNSGAGHSAGQSHSGGRPSGGSGGRGKFFRRKKVCKFCTEKIDAISYRDVRLLQGFVAERGKIVPRRLTGVCTTHQRRLSRAIKQARNIALLPFATRH